MNFLRNTSYVASNVGFAGAAAVQGRREGVSDSRARVGARLAKAGCRRLALFRGAPQVSLL